MKAWRLEKVRRRPYRDRVRNRKWGCPFDAFAYELCKEVSPGLAHLRLLNTVQVESREVRGTYLLSSSNWAMDQLAKSEGRFTTPGSLRRIIHKQGTHHRIP
jgi:hypothetical protein